MPPTYFPLASPASLTSPTPTPGEYSCLPEVYSDEYALVLWVVDGSNIVVDIQGKRQAVRYLGLEAPSLTFPSQPFSDQSKAFNQVLVTDQVVRLVRDVSDTDRYGQLLRYVLVGDYFINYEMVRSGLGRAVSQAPDLACQDELMAAQRQAELANDGLWALPTPSLAASISPFPSPSPTLTIFSAALTPTGTITPPTLTPTGTITPPTLTPTGTITPPTFTPTGTITPPTFTPTGTITPSTLTPTGTISPPAPTATPSTVYIEAIHYADSSPDESGEYVQIRNGSAAVVNLQDWVLENSDTTTMYVFPNYTVQPGQYCRLYTNQSHFDTCGFNFFRNTPVWDNTQGCAALYSAQTEQLVSELCYP
jgi:endonuclease YncB( thermonuclease family)